MNKDHAYVILFGSVYGHVLAVKNEPGLRIYKLNYSQSVGRETNQKTAYWEFIDQNRHRAVLFPTPKAAKQAIIALKKSPCSDWQGIQFSLADWKKTFEDSAMHRFGFKELIIAKVEVAKAFGSYVDTVETVASVKKEGVSA